MALKHQIDFVEEIDKLSAVIADDLSIESLPTKLRLMLLSKLYDKWLDGYNQGFVDSSKRQKI